MYMNKKTFKGQLTEQLKFLYDHSVSNEYGGWLEECVDDITALVLEMIGEDEALPVIWKTEESDKTVTKGKNQLRALLRSKLLED